MNTMRSKEIEMLENSKQKLKNTITELKNKPKGFNRRLDEPKDRINELEDKAVKLTRQENQKKRRNFTH